MDRWEYNVYYWQGRISADESKGIWKKLDEFGAEGWELVNVIPQVMGIQANMGVTGNVMIFKRLAV